MKKLLATLLGALIFFVWSAVVHMNPLTGMMGLSVLNDKEDAVVAALQANVPQPGIYFFPGLDQAKCTPEQRAAWTAKYKAGPTGMVLMQPKGGDPMMTSQMLVSFAADVLCAGLAACILASTVGSFFCRVTKVAMLGLFAWLAISVQQWNWYSFPFAFVSLDAINQVIGWTLAGLVMAKIIKPVSQPVQSN